jgi:protein TonB
MPALPIPVPPVAEAPRARKPEPMPRRKVEVPPVKAVKERVTPAPKPIENARGRTGVDTAAADRDATARGGTAGRATSAGTASITNYRGQLVAHLTRFKIYPDQAQDRGITGRNAVTITVSREGTVLSAALSNPSGHGLLDSATLAAVKRAQPFPRMPEGGPGSLTVTIGLNYELR